MHFLSALFFLSVKKSLFVRYKTQKRGHQGGSDSHLLRSLRLSVLKVWAQRRLDARSILHEQPASLNSPIIWTKENGNWGRFGYTFVTDFGGETRRFRFVSIPVCGQIVLLIKRKRNKECVWYHYALHYMSLLWEFFDTLSLRFCFFVFLH